MYFLGWENTGRNQIWTQGQGKYTSHWLPSVDNVNDKIEFDLKYLAPEGYEVVSNGKLISKTEVAGNNLWTFDMQKPMSSYLVAVTVGEYNKKTETSKSVPSNESAIKEDSCPKCNKGTIIKGKTAYGCSEYKTGCDFRFSYDAVREKAKGQLTKEVVFKILRGFYEGRHGFGARRQWLSFFLYIKNLNNVKRVLARNPQARSYRHWPWCKYIRQSG